MFLSVAFFAIFFALGNLDYSTVFSLAPFVNETIVVLVGLLLLFAAIGKSAQLGLHTWLPDSFSSSSKIYPCNTRYLLYFNNFAPKEEQGPWPEPTNKRNSREISDFFYHFVIGLIISGDLICRVHKDNLTARLVYQIYENSED